VAQVNGFGDMRGQHDKNRDGAQTVERLDPLISHVLFFQTLLT
jgi:hypothetical protein